MPSPLRLCVRRSPGSDGGDAGTLVTLRLPSEVACIEEAVSYTHLTLPTTERV